jgi:hypothetical protein
MAGCADNRARFDFLMGIQNKKALIASALKFKNIW